MHTFAFLLGIYNFIRVYGTFSETYFSKIPKNMKMRESFLTLAAHWHYIKKEKKLDIFKIYCINFRKLFSWNLFFNNINKLCMRVILET